MPESEKKRRSGRSREESSDDDEPKPKKKKAASGEPTEKLLSPWGPLVWLLIPLFACVAYGLATRGH